MTLVVRIVPIAQFFFSFSFLTVRYHRNIHFHVEKQNRERVCVLTRKKSMDKKEVEIAKDLTDSEGTILQQRN